MSALLSAVRRMPRELKLFIVATFVISLGYSLIDSTLNNFLNERYALTGFQRSFLELPRELPGVLVVVVSAALWFLASRRLGALAMLLGVAGTLLMGFAAPSYVFMIAWLFIYNMGSHLWMPIASSVGMELAEAGKTGQRLGQLNAIRNLAAILGSFLVFVGFKFLHFNFHHTFLIAAAGFVIAALLLFRMRPEKTTRPKTYITLHREYRLYYILAVLFGARKQLFITFAPWVIVTVFNQPTSTLATLFTIGGIIGILFQPLLGWAVDHLGERFVLASEALVLILVCGGYGFARSLFPENMAFLVICACYLVDQMLMSVGMARSTYMKKIALQPSDIQPALATSISIDHIFSICIALLAGVIWNAVGYQYVFLLGAGIAFINFFAAMQIRIPPAAEAVVPPGISTSSLSS